MTQQPRDVERKLPAHGMRAPSLTSGASGLRETLQTHDHEPPIQ